MNKLVFVETTQQWITFKVNKYKLKLSIIFVDFAKVFNSIEHIYILQVQQYQGINQKYTRLLGKVYKQGKMKTVKTGENIPL